MGEKIDPATTEVEIRRDGLWTSVSGELLPLSNLRTGEKITKDKAALIYDLLGIQSDGNINQEPKRINYGIIAPFLVNIPELSYVELIERAIEVKLGSRGIPREVARQFAELASKFIGTPLLPLPSSKSEEQKQWGEVFNLLSDLGLAFHQASQANAVVSANQRTTLFSDRDKAATPTAEAFLRATYEGRLGMDGDLTQASLRAIDPPLMRALDLEFIGQRRAILRELLPTKTERVNARLKEALGYIPTGKERKSAVTVLGRGQTPKPKGR